MRVIVMPGAVGGLPIKSKNDSRKDQLAKRDKELLDEAVKKHGLTTGSSGSGFFSGGSDGAAILESVQRADNVDEAVHDAILNTLLQTVPAAEGAAAPPAPEPPAPQILTAAVALNRAKTWAESVNKTLRVLKSAERDRRDIPLGRAYPWEISFVWSCPNVVPVHWSNASSSNLGKACRLDADDRIIWPTNLNTVMQDFSNLPVLHPALGIRARKDKALREKIPPGQIASETAV